MANYFIIGSDGKEYGPVTGADVRQWMAAGRVGLQSKARIEGAAEWKLLSEFPEFSAPPPSPPPLPAGAAPANVKTSALAVTSLVLGILGLFTCGATALFGLIFGIIALVKVSNSQGALRGRGLALAGTITSGVFLLLIPIMAALMLPALAAAHDKAREIDCMNNEKQLALDVIIYSGSHADHFPPAATWCDAIRSSNVSDNIFKCPAVNSTSLTNRCDYAFNAKLDGLDLSKVNPQTVVIFESDAGWNAHGGPELLPAAKRHGRGNRATLVVAFADGHVQIVSESGLSALRWNP